MDQARLAQTNLKNSVTHSKNSIAASEDCLDVPSHSTLISPALS